MPFWPCWSERSVGGRQKWGKDRNVPWMSYMIIIYIYIHICWLFLECGSLSYEHDTPCQARWTLPLSSLAHPKSNLIYELLLSQEENVWNSGKQQIRSFSACSFSSAFPDWLINLDPFHVSNLSVSSMCIRFGSSFCISIGVHPNMWSIPGWWIDIFRALRNIHRNRESHNLQDLLPNANASIDSIEQLQLAHRIQSIPGYVSFSYLPFFLK